MPIALCLEDMDSGRFVKCVAIAGGRPGLGLDPEPRWRSPKPHLTLGETADERLAIKRPEGALPSTLLRGTRALEVPEAKPVIVLDGDVLKLDERSYRVHLHGATRRVAPPEPLRRPRPSRLAVGLLAAGALIEVRCSPPDPVDSDVFDDPSTCGAAAPPELDFGTLVVGDEPTTLELSLENLCSMWMDLEGFAVLPAEAPFRVTQSPSDIRGDSSVSITVEFAPEEVGDWEARLTIAPEHEFPEVTLLGAAVEAR